MTELWRKNYTRGSGRLYAPSAQKGNLLYEGYRDGLGSEDYLAEISERMIQEHRRDW